MLLSRLAKGPATGGAGPTAAGERGPVLYARNATLGYRSRAVVTGLDLSLYPGEALAIAGPNGSGKSTVVRTITGSALVLSGSLRVVGIERSHRPRFVPAGRIGYVPQSSNLDPDFPITAAQVVEQSIVCGRAGPLLDDGRRFSASRRRALGAAALARVGLSEVADRRFGELSGGQRQRVLLARSLVSCPDLIVLDEPFNGLDAPNREKLVETVQWAKRQSIACVIVTHDFSLAHRTCEHAVLLGSDAARAGATSDVLTEQRLAEAFGLLGRADA